MEGRAREKVGHALSPERGPRGFLSRPMVLFVLPEQVFLGAWQGGFEDVSHRVPEVRGS